MTGIDLDLPGDGIRLAATRWPGTGLPVLLLHGLASRRGYWEPVLPRLAGLPLVALDQRGHGDSEKPETGYDPATVAGDACVALDALGLSRVVVVGHSWGGLVALAMAAERPERVLSVVVVDGVIGAPGEHLGRAAARERLTPPYSIPGGLPFERHMDVVDTMLDHDYTAMLRKVACPAWVMVVEPDDPEWAATKARHADRVRALLADNRLIRLHGADHDVPLQWPDLVAGVVRAAVTEAGSR